MSYFSPEIKVSIFTRIKYIFEEKKNPKTFSRLRVLKLLRGSKMFTKYFAINAYSAVIQSLPLVEKKNKS